ncbi:MAG: glucokinase [bacterium]|nr:glucokinase [bacterium]
MAENQGTLVADIGGTRARFGVIDADGDLTEVRILPTSSYPTLVDAASDYLAGLEPGDRPSRGAIAIAGPVHGDRVQMTNRLWSFSVGETGRVLGLETLEVLNDFIALALAVPGLPLQQSREVKAGRSDKDAPLAVIGPGTGLGVSALVPVASLAPENGWIALATEGGHRDLAATNEREWRIVERLQHRFGRVSAERVLSGPGLVNLYSAICELEGLEVEARVPEGVVARSLAGSCAASQEAVEVFARQLGAVAGDLVLTYGAQGGVWLGGGVLHGMSTAFDIGLFRHGFLDKGRFRSYVEPVPVRLILDPTAPLRGAARALESESPSGVRVSGTAR